MIVPPVRQHLPKIAFQFVIELLFHAASQSSAVASILCRISHAALSVCHCRITVSGMRIPSSPGNECDRTSLRPMWQSPFNDHEILAGIENLHDDLQCYKVLITLRVMFAAGDYRSQPRPSTMLPSGNRLRRDITRSVMSTFDYPRSTALRNTSSSVARRGRRWRICNPSAARRFPQHLVVLPLRHLDHQKFAVVRSTWQPRAASRDEKRSGWALRRTS